MEHVVSASGITSKMSISRQGTNIDLSSMIKGTSKIDECYKIVDNSE